MTASELILKRLEEAPRPLAVHELGIVGVSDNAAATRLSELQSQGKVVGVFRKGFKYKEWRVVHGHIYFRADGQGDFVGA